MRDLLSVWFSIGLLYGLLECWIRMEDKHACEVDIYKIEIRELKSEIAWVDKNNKELEQWKTELQLENKDLKEKIAILTSLLMDKNGK